MPRKRSLSDEEKKLWKEATRGIKPLDREFLQPEEEPEIPIAKPRIRVKPSPPAPPPLPKSKAPLTQGAYADIDKNTATRFKKGDGSIDATLDLHGMTAAKAYDALTRFISRHASQGSRTFLVITGKGGANGSGRGILRESLPAWLAAPELRGYILAFDVAKPKHGGEGAFYILLKRKR